MFRNSFPPFVHRLFHFLTREFDKMPKTIASALKAVCSPDETRLVYALGHASRDVAVTTVNSFGFIWTHLNFRQETVEG